jgi:hypothetical protein
MRLGFLVFLVFLRIFFRLVEDAVCPEEGTLTGFSPLNSAPESVFPQFSKFNVSQFSFHFVSPGT